MRKIVYIICAFLLVSCSNKNSDNSKYSFDPMSNFPGEQIVSLDMDLYNVVNNGIVIPSSNQCDEGCFVVKFEAKKGQYYKIFYQNESYKFDNDNPLNDENFYGSWEDVNIGFKKVEESGLVVDSIRIVGNPRDEKKYYGADVTKNSFSEEAVNKVVTSIKNTPDWLESVKKKAEKNGYTLDKQLHLDALWIINDGRNKGDFNNRFKRNPRVGEYSFMLVVCNEDGLNEIPEYIKNISVTNEEGKFVNPYAYFANNTSKNIDVVYSSRNLKTRAVILNMVCFWMNCR